MNSFLSFRSEENSTIISQKLKSAFTCFFLNFTGFLGTIPFEKKCSFLAFLKQTKANCIFLHILEHCVLTQPAVGIAITFGVNTFRISDDIIYFLGEKFSSLLLQKIIIPWTPWNGSRILETHFLRECYEVFSGKY